MEEIFHHRQCPETSFIQPQNPVCMPVSFEGDPRDKTSSLDFSQETSAHFSELFSVK